ncbi:response regulator [Sphingomonas changnyeongensis]|uniref:Response regulator n=1 Tax=Sphingomonas changnyeongensis TaxID=2698679 RepID=A0A7Z2NYC3_9SPHN|nr:response regulator [Sphingomonas changnyeongensis]QHL91652.1 response regulator [Sphingomonas changnyeongensis]
MLKHPPSSSPPPRILVVDDEPDLREELCEWLALRGLPAVMAGDVEGALGVLRVLHGIETVLTDIRLGSASGLDLVRRARRDPALAGRHLHFALMTGQTDLTDHARDEIAELDAVLLAKPIDLGRLLGLLQAPRAA